MARFACGGRLAIQAAFSTLILTFSRAHINLKPGDDIPFGFKVATVDLNGSIGSYILDPSSHLGVPLVLHAYLQEDATLRYMWNGENSNSVAAFLQDAPEDTHFLFLSYGLNATGDMQMMQSRFTELLQGQGLSSEEIAAKLKNFHFTRDPMSGVSDQGANFIPYLMGEWQASNKIVKLSLGGEMRTVGRLDSVFDWIPAGPPQARHPLVQFGDGCQDRTPYDAKGGVALVVRTKQDCTFAEIISRAQSANASAVLVSAVEGEDVIPMNCEGKQCQLALHTFATMIPYATAQEAGSSIDATVEFGEESGPGYFAAVDGSGRLQEVGWVKLPSLQHLSWAAQWLQYQEGLSKRLQEKDTLVVPIFENEIMQGEHGIVKEVTLPPITELQRYGKLELDFQLGCPGIVDADCPIWDHVVQLFVCSGSECDPCDPTPWLHQHHPGSSGNACADDTSELEWQQRWRSQNQTAAESECGRELGRWVTPFRRGVGRWLTDATPLRGLISSDKCRFTAQTAPWALPWKPSLRLRYSQPSPPSRPGYNVLSTAPLFGSKTFDGNYNKDRLELAVLTPHGTVQVLLYAVITGHGSDEFNCAEFCPTSHHFTINGEEVAMNFTEAGTQWGCTKHVLDGVEPNEHGTWQYGRGGWCDGQNVRPHVFDVTDLVSYAGRTSQVGYHGLFRGADPDPQKAPGFIMLQSSLVFIGNNLTSHAVS